MLASLRCALARVPPLARTGAARQRPTNRRRLESTSFLLKSARRSGSRNYFVFGIDRTSSSTKSITRVRIASSAAVRPSLRAGTSSQRTNRPRGCGNAPSAHPVASIHDVGGGELLRGDLTGLRDRNRIALPLQVGGHSRGDARVRLSASRLDMNVQPTLLRQTLEIGGRQHALRRPMRTHEENRRRLAALRISCTRL